MIVYRKGDLLEALRKGEIDILAHGCNMNGGFGSGIAGQIAKQFPMAKDMYLIHYPKYELGDFMVVKLDDNKRILNCFTQRNYGREKTRYMSYDAVSRVFAAMMHSTGNHHKIGIPKIGAGLGGGNWDIIERIINDVIGSRTIYCYELEE